MPNRTSTRKPQRAAEPAPRTAKNSAPRADASARDATTRDAILDAAEMLFARQGFTATTTKEIGAAARMNPALISYYFGGKEALYREVLRRLFGELIEEGQRRIDASLSPDQAVARFVEVQVRFLSTHQTLPRLLVRELVDHEARHAEPALTELAAGMFQRLCGVIRAGQSTGLFRNDLDPRHAAISIVAQVVYLFVARPAVGILLGYGPHGLPQEEVDQFGRHAARFALAALTSGVER